MLHKKDASQHLWCYLTYFLSLLLGIFNVFSYWAMTYFQMMPSIISCSGINLVWKLGCGFGFKKTVGSWVLTVQQMEACSTRLNLRVSSSKFNLIFLKSHHFGKCFLLIFLYITVGYWYNNISWRPHDPHPKIWGCDPSTPRIDGYDFMYSHQK